MFYPPVWLVWWLRAPSALGWLTVGHLLWGGLGVYVLVAIDRAGPMGGDGRGGSLPGLAVSPGPHVRGPLPARLGGLLVSLGVLGLSRAPRRPGPRARCLPPILALTFLTGHPQEWLLLVLALSAWAVADGAARPGDRAEPRRSAARVAAVAGAPGAVDRDGRRSTSCPSGFVRPWLRRNHDPGLEVGIPGRYHLGGLNAFQLLSPTALGGPSDYFGDDNYWETVFSIGLVPLVLAVVAALRHPDRRLVRGWLVLAGLAVAFACGRSLGLYSLVLRDSSRASADPRAGAVAVPRQPGRRGARRARRRDAPDTDGRPRRLAAARRPARRGRGRRDGAACSLIQLRRVRRWPTDGRPHDGLAATGAPSRLPLPDGRPAPRRGCSATAASGSALGGTVDPGSPSDAGRSASGAVASSSACSGWSRWRELGWYGFCADPGRAGRSGSSVRTRSVRRLARSARGAEVRGGSAAIRLPVRIKARDSFYGDLPASVHGIEKTNVNDAFQLDHAAALYETLYPVASRVRPMAERLMSRPAKDDWRRIRQAVFDRMSVDFLVSDRVETGSSLAGRGRGDVGRLAIRDPAQPDGDASRLRRAPRDDPAGSSRRGADVARRPRPAHRSS